MGKPFADGLNFYKLFWVFFVGCFLGVIIEMAWCGLRFHRIESRTGLIYGPFNLVYGFGALIMTLALVKLVNQRDFVIFSLGALIGAVYEYMCSVVQEKLVGSISWDYSDFPLNLNGRINLLYCFFWGILALLWVRDAYPRFSALIEKIPENIGRPLTWVCIAFMIFNTLMSACVVYRKSCRDCSISAKNGLERYIDAHYPDERIAKIYPNMKFVKIGDMNG